MIYKLKVVNQCITEKIKVTLEADSNLAIKVAYSREKIVNRNLKLLWTKS